MTAGTTPSTPQLSVELLQQGLLATALHRQMGLVLQVDDGILRLTGVLGAELARGDGHDVAHGGAVAALLDTATVWAAVVRTTQLWATADLRVDYLRPTPLGDVVVTATVLHAGATVARTRAELSDVNGRICAAATATLVAQANPGTTHPA
jgi:uncharacterized protein (TIGR00369 family)